jgi:hypothetical protein
MEGFLDVVLVAVEAQAQEAIILLHELFTEWRCAE